MQGTPSPPPIVIKIAEPKTSELQGLSDVLLGSIGLAGVLILAGVLLAAVFAGVLFLWRRWRESTESEPEDLHIV